MTERNWQRDWELCEKATPGPWEWRWVDVLTENGSHLLRLDAGTKNVLITDRTNMAYRDYNPLPSEEDQAFIAEAREALPYWLHRVRELEQVVEKQKRLYEAAKRVVDAVFGKEFDRKEYEIAMVWLDGVVAELEEKESV